ncbi:serine incorporator/TMS membrane protein [Morchella snyderi]|nr:serine incorporator/TMS membrane protein [Morchella snyderi]
MGALLSIPFLAVPGLYSVGSFLLSCCGAAACSALCSACGKCNSSTATRISYALIFLVNCILSWIMLTPWAIKRLEHLALDYFPISCMGEKCYGFVAVHRIQFALGFFHAVLAVILLGVNSTRDGRAAIQNGYWGPKIIAWFLLIVITFLIPENFFLVWGNYFALIGAMLFLLLGLILLVDLAHTWAETCLEKIEESDSKAWRGILLGSTLGMYIGSIALTIVMYIFFAGTGCSMNQTAITINLLLFLGVSFVSIHPTIQEYNSRAGLAQSAMVAIYCTYLTMSAVSMEPDDKQCNPLLRARGTRTASIVLGAIVTFLTIAYTTTRAASQGVGPLNKGTPSPANGGYTAIGDSEHGLITTEPTRSEMRARALRRAVDDGSLPASALDEESDDEDDRVARTDDEKFGAQYSYTGFHIIFFLATAWTATLLTMSLEPGKGDEDSFSPVGRTYAASWVKIVSAWVCYLLYTWTLIAPVVLPDRF